MHVQVVTQFLSVSSQHRLILDRSFRHVIVLVLRLHCIVLYKRARSYHYFFVLAFVAALRCGNSPPESNSWRSAIIASCSACNVQKAWICQPNRVYALCSVADLGKRQTLSFLWPLLGTLLISCINYYLHTYQLNIHYENEVISSSYPPSVQHTSDQHS